MHTHTGPMDVPGPLKMSVRRKLVSKLICSELHDRSSIARTSVTEVQTTTSVRRTCLVLRDVSSMETDADEQRIGVYSSGGCADDLDVLDAIETCYGVRPIPLSRRFINRPLKASGKYLDINWYDFLLVVYSNFVLSRTALLGTKKPAARNRTDVLFFRFAMQTYFSA